MRSILEVTSAASSHDLTVLATVKLELGITDTSSDDLLTAYIKQVSNAIMSWCRRVFASEGVTETFWPSGGYCRAHIRELTLKRFPVTALTSITLDDDAALDASLYRLDADTGQVFALDNSGYPSWFCFAKRAAVVYVAGYTPLDDLPFDIERACLQWVKELYFGGERDPRVRSENNQGVASFSYFDRVNSLAEPPPEVAQLLAPYRQVLVG